MSDVCSGGQFDGYKLTTPRDKELCREGGGEVVGGPPDPNPCGGAAVAGFARGSGRQLSTPNLYRIRALLGGSNEVHLLQRLSAASVPAVEQSLVDDPEMSERLVEALVRLEEIASRLINSESHGPTITEDEHAYFTEIARILSDKMQDESLRALVNETIEKSRPFIGAPVAEVVDTLAPRIDVNDISTGSIDVEASTRFPDMRSQVHDFRRGPTNPLTSLPVPPALMKPLVELKDVYDKPGFDIGSLVALKLAADAIAEKAQSLGESAGEKIGGIEIIAGVKESYRQQYSDRTIYWSDSTGAHEIHGDIRLKYDAVNGPLNLGLPVTDETSTPDSRGRFNHFSKEASIYWTSTTGPFCVQRASRFRWASTGWEGGVLGYPVGDQQRMTGLYPEDDVDIQWVKFEKGVVVADHGDAQMARTASVSKKQLTDAFFRMIDRNFTSREFNIGLITVTARPGLYGVEVVGVESGKYDFWATQPRTLHLRVRGFVSLPVKDPTWEIELKLQFATTWQSESFLAPAHKTLVARLVWFRIHVEGMFSETIASTISEGVQNTFASGPDGTLRIADLPTGASQRGKGNLDIIDAMLMEDGTLSVFLNPIPNLAGKLRQTTAQRAIEQALDQV